MDRNARKNLEALAEEEDEEEVERSRDSDDSETETEDDEEGSGVWRGEPNKFDGLCDGLLNAMALVHSALTELLDFKDELLRHSLPPTVLIHLAMTSSKLFRSVSDLSMPANELVRLVRVYSTPWEEKSAALKKLHEDYESKQRQLNIAIKRLQLVDAHSKRIAKEKRIMNWEKLFAKLTSTKGHGRRWKFLIETIKQKAKMGLEHVNAYTQALEESMDLEDEDVPTQAPTTRPEVRDAVSENQESEDFDEGGDQGGADTKSSSRGDDDEKEDEDDDEDDEEKGDEAEESASEASTVKFGNEDVPIVTIEIAPEGSDDEAGSVLSRTGSPKKVRFEEEKARVTKPPSRDIEAWTGEPDYDRSLFVRIFCPEGLEQTQIRCTLTYDGKIFKTGVLDEDDPEDAGEAERPSKRPRAAGKRTTPEESPPHAEGAKKSKKFREFEIKLPDAVPLGALNLSKHVEEPTNFQIAIHHGQYEELLAMATIDFQDVKELHLQTVYLPPPHGDDDVLRDRGSLSDMGDLESLSDSVDLMLVDDSSETQGGPPAPRDDPAKDFDALPFPLYSLHAGKSDALHKPCGTLPLVLYWGKRQRPRVFNKQAGTLGVYDLVYDLTGIDLTTTTKKDLHKETMNRSASAIAFTPETEEETVPKMDYDRMVANHQDELQYLQEEYEKRLSELMHSLQSMQEENIALSQQQQAAILRPLSTGSRGSRGSTTSPGPVTFHSPIAPKKPITPQTVSLEKTASDITRGGDPSTIPDTASSGMRPMPPKTQRNQRNFRIGRPLPKWGESLPQDFFERLRLFEEESRLHKQELNERTLRDIKETLEKKLAGQHKLSKREEQMYDALKDVSLPALFMPIRTGNIFNPRAHQYFHPTGSTEMRLTQPPSVFQLPPLPHSNKMSVVNLFELSKNFHNHGPDWLVERYIQQQQPVTSINTYPQTPGPTTSIQHQMSAQRSPQPEHESQTGSGIDDSHSGHPLSMPEQEVEA